MRTEATIELSNTFTLHAPAEECWTLLTDVEKVASCIPGFTASGWDSDTYTGSLKVKVGAVTVTYDSRIRLVETDDAELRASIRAEGRERKGQGSATATMRSQLREAGVDTEVTIVAEVDVSGRVAGFGRGILADVSSRLVTRFARNVETTFLNPGDEPVRTESAAGTPGDVTANLPLSDPPIAPARGHASGEPLDLVRLSAAPTLRRLAPAVGACVLLLILLRRHSR